MDTHPQQVEVPSAAQTLFKRFQAKAGHATDHDDLQRLLEQDHDFSFASKADTLAKWRLLARMASIDLTCAKLFESHVDALTILHELRHGHLINDGGLWAVWCAESPGHKVHISAHSNAQDGVYLDGVKAWCSGADAISHALISCWNPAGEQCLAVVHMQQPAVLVSADGWSAVGMGHTDSVDVRFEHAVGTVVGKPGDYVNRPGFMHGAAGIAACWLGAASGIARYVLEHARQRPDDQHVLAHLGAIDVALIQATRVLSCTASEIDSTPLDSCVLSVRRARLAVEAAVETVLHHAPRALGAGPLCKSAHLARLFADLPVFVRQSHAERDLAAHGRSLGELKEQALWTL